MEKPFTIERIAVLDTETTALKPSNISNKHRTHAGRVLQYGMVILAASNLRILEKRMTYVLPSADDWVHSSPEAMKVNGITSHVLGRYGREPNEALSLMFGGATTENRDWWNRTMLACWGTDFDVGFIESEYDLCGRKSPLNYRTLDVRSVCNAIVPTFAAGTWEYEGLRGWLARNVSMGHTWTRDVEDEVAERAPRIGDGHDALIDALWTVLALRSALRAVGGVSY